MAVMRNWLTDVFSGVFALCLIAAAISFNLEAFVLSLLFFAGVLVSAAVLILINRKSSSGKR